jgi:hypothetical protein
MPSGADALDSALAAAGGDTIDMGRLVHVATIDSCRPKTGSYLLG